MPEYSALGIPGRCRLAKRTETIPLRNTAAANGHPDRREKHCSPEPQTSEQKIRRWPPLLCSVPEPGAFTTGNPPPWKCEAVVSAYLRAAQAYMLISMPTGTSTIFGVFQAISDLLSNGTTDCRACPTIGSPSNWRKRARVNIPLQRARPHLYLLEHRTNRNSKARLHHLSLII